MATTLFYLISKGLEVHWDDGLDDKRVRIGHTLEAFSGVEHLHSESIIA